MKSVHNGESSRVVSEIIRRRADEAREILNGNDDNDDDNSEGNEKVGAMGNTSF